MNAIQRLLSTTYDSPEALADMVCEWRRFICVAVYQDGEVYVQRKGAVLRKRLDDTEIAAFLAWEAQQP